MVDVKEYKNPKWDNEWRLKPQKPYNEKTYMIKTSKTLQWKNQYVEQNENIIPQCVNIEGIQFHKDGDEEKPMEIGGGDRNAKGKMKEQRTKWERGQRKIKQKKKEAQEEMKERERLKVIKNRETPWKNSKWEMRHV